MATRCDVCGEYPIRGAVRTFFPWPTDPSQRTYWQTCLGVQDLNLNKPELFICSDHFDQMQMIRKGTALRKDAFPKRYDGPLPTFLEEDGAPKVEPPSEDVKNEDVGIFDDPGPSAPVFDDEEIMPEELSMAKLVQMFAAAAKERPTTIAPFVTPISEETRAFSNILIDRQEKYLETYCKSCLRQAELVNMLEANCEGVPVTLMYKAVFMTEITPSDVPQLMCHTCIGLLFQCFKFSTMSARSCEVLQAARERFKYLSPLDDGTIDLKNIPDKYSAKPCPRPESDVEDQKDDVKVVKRSVKKRKSVVKSKEVPPEKKGRRTSTRRASEQAKKVSKKILEDSDEDDSNNDNFDNDEADPDFDAQEVKDESPEVSDAEVEEKEEDKDDQDPEDNYCMLCRHQFSNMARHMDKVHRVDWESKSCERCKVSFDFPEQVFGHLKTENHDIACKDCNAEFKDNEAYKKHLKSEVCEKTRRTITKTKPLKKRGRKPLKPQNEEVKKESKVSAEWVEITREDIANIANENGKPDTKTATKKKSKKKFKFTCNKCEIGHNAFKDMFDHLRSDHKDTLSCIFCEEIFLNEVQLLDHVGEHSKSFYCRIHFIAFKTRSELRSHYKLPNHQFECGICEEVLKSRSARYSHRRRHLFPEEEAKCPHCPLVYRHYPNLARHIKTFHMEKTYLCEQCGVSYSTNHALKIHVERDHHGMWEKKGADLCCEDCGKTFKYIKNLRMHKATHLGHTEFCRHCHESFENIEKLNEHMKEKGHELFTCDQCLQTFVRRGVYLLHLEKHKYSGDERMKRKLHPKRRKILKLTFFKCPYCEKEFKSKIQMKEHARMHSDDKPFKCNVCEKCFKRGPTLYAHKRVHLGYKNYRCKYCDKTFTQPGGLAQHTMIHTGERPHKCEICGKGFITTTSLKKHLETHRKASNIV